MVWLKPVLRFFANPVADAVGSWSARKEVAAKSAARIAEAKVDFKVAKFEARAERERRELSMDGDYDMMVLKNKDRTFADEIVIGTFLTTYAAHFIPKTQPYMASGWSAMGYGDSPAWWFEFAMVGILVSTLGLMRLLKLFFTKKGVKSDST